MASIAINIEQYCSYTSCIAVIVCILSFASSSFVVDSQMQCYFDYPL